MNALKSMVLGFALACLASCPTYAWSIKSSTKTHVRICAIDEERKPVESVEVLVRLNYGRGRIRKYTTDQDGMISFTEDIGACAKCRLSLDEEHYYRSRITFWPSQSGSVVTSVIKRVVKPSGMVRMSFGWNLTNAIHKVGIDLLAGDLVSPYGKGRYTDLYLAGKGWRDETIVREGNDDNTIDCSEYWFERAESSSEFTIVPKDDGCQLPTPTVAPKDMRIEEGVKFLIDYRPQKHTGEYIGQNKYVIFKAVRPAGEFYGVIIGGVFKWFPDKCYGELSCCINPEPGDRGIVWTTDNENTDAWRKRVEAWYAEEDAEKKKTVK